MNPIDVDFDEVEVDQKALLQARYGEVLTTQEATAKYCFLGFGAPFVMVIRKSDNVAGTLQFTHQPRFYFNFQAG